MSRCLLHFRVLNNDNVHDVWVRQNGKVGPFLQDVVKSWNVDLSTYAHFFYHCELQNVLDETKTWKENHVLSGDHLILL